MEGGREWRAVRRYKGGSELCGLGVNDLLFHILSFLVSEVDEFFCRDMRTSAVFRVTSQNNVEVGTIYIPTVFAFRVGGLMTC